MLSAFTRAAPAHMSLPGANEIVNGFLHPLVTLAHVVIIVALGIALGQHPPLKLRPIGVFCVALAGALGAALAAPGWIVPPVALNVVALGAGAVVAVGRSLPAGVSYTLGIGAAIVLGLDSRPEGVTLLGGIKTVVGTWVSASAWVATIAFWTSQGIERRNVWIAIGLRVAGSWVFAISLLMLAFAVRK